MDGYGHGARDATGRAMTRPIILSAAGHIFAVSVFLLLGADRGPAARLLPVVEVLLVGEDPGPAGAERSGPAWAGAPRRIPGLPPPPRGDEAPLPRVDGRPAGAAAAPPGSAAPAARAISAADAIARQAGPPAAAPAPGIAAGPAAPGPGAEAALVLPGDRRVVAGSSAAADSGAPFGPAAVPAAGPGQESTPGARTGRSPLPEERAGDGGRSRHPDSRGAGPSMEVGRIGASGPLREWIQARIGYPEKARRSGLEGEVLLLVHIAAGGVPNRIGVARSSGFRLLDDAALQGVVRAAPLPSSPGWFEVPIRFHLR